MIAFVESESGCNLKSLAIVILIAVSLSAARTVKAELVFAPNAPAATVLTFEEFAGHDGAKLSKFYQGIRFISERSGLEWTARDMSMGEHPFSSWPGGEEGEGGDYWIHDSVAAGPQVVERARIDFLNSAASFVEFAYSSEHSLVVRAYNAAGQLVDKAIGRSNRRYSDENAEGPGVLRLDAGTGERISYVTFRGGGGYWVLDELTADADITVVPAPAALALGAIGLGCISLRRRFKRSAI